MKAVLAAALMALLLPIVAVANNGGHGGGHDPVTICHKPGTPAEQTLVVDDDAVPGHLGHGDYLGACQTEEPPPDNGGVGEESPPPVDPPVGHDCTYTGAGKDGAEGNDDCAVETTAESTPDVCQPTVVTVEKIVPVTVTKTITKVVPRIVVKWKTKIVYRTKIKTVVKTKRVYVAGVHANGVEGSG